MNPDLSIGLLATLLLLFATGCGPSAEETGTGDVSRPNIVLIVADDLGYGDLGSYGQLHIQTPHLDRMADEGMRFTQFYAGSTVCAPSRSVLMTGRHLGHTPIRSNTDIEPFGEKPLPDSSLTVAEVLQEAGYRTGAFGKWGLGAPGTEGVPHRQGFDEFFGYISQYRAHFYWPEFLFRSDRDSLWRVPLEGNRVNGNPDRHPGSGPPIERGTYSHDAIMDEAMNFIESSAGGEPFFAYLPVTIPHASVVAPEEAFSPYVDDEGTSIFDETPYTEGHYTAQKMPKAAYAAMVSHLDESVGRLLDRLEANGLDENTLVLFTSDNGPHSEGGYRSSDFDSSGPLRGMKRDLYEGGIRVPQIAWWPGHVGAGTTTDVVSYFGDYMHTFSVLAGTAPPDSIDSISLVPTLLGRPDLQAKHDYLYWEHFGNQAVRKGAWKAVRYGDETLELYNLEEDLNESENVADEYPKVVEKMNTILKNAQSR